MSLTDYTEGQIGAHLLRSASWPKPSNIYVALFTSDPTDAGTTADEVSGGNYARVAAGPADAYWTPPAAGNKTFSNAVDLTFPAPNADWGYVTHFALIDAASGGTMLASAVLPVPRMIYGTDPAPVFATGDFKLVFNGVASDYLVDQIGMHLLRTGNWTKPAGIYAALFTDTPTEVAGGSYARVAAGPSDSAWSGPTSGDGHHANTMAIVWSVPTADWGNVGTVKLYDEATAGNALAAISLAAARIILNGSLAPNFAPGDLSVTFD